MKKTLAAILTLIIIACSLPVYADASLGSITAQRYIVIDADSGQILAEKGSADAAYPASITKIMTLALALQKSGGDMSTQLTVTRDNIALEPGSSHIALQDGEVISLADAFSATMLMSANDAANVLAAYVAGTQADFPDIMNAKAAEIGMTGTHFVNAHGLNNADHYTTAADMAKLTRWALTVPGFIELFGSTEYKMAPTNKQSKERLFGTDNCMLVTNKYQYEGTLGGKSGWTQESGYTMVEACERGGRRLIAVVLASAQKYDKFSDCITLFDYCFENYINVSVDGQQFDAKSVPVYGGGDEPIGSVDLYLPSFTVILPKGQSAENLDVTYNVPEKYIIGQPFNATADVSLMTSGGSATLLATVNLTSDSLGEILARNTGVASVPVLKDKSSFPWNTILIIIAGITLPIAALIGGRMAYVAFVKAQRKKRKMARLRALYGYNRSAEMVPRQANNRIQRNINTKQSVRNIKMINGGKYYNDLPNVQQR